MNNNILEFARFASQKELKEWANQNPKEFKKLLIAYHQRRTSKPLTFKQY